MFVSRQIEITMNGATVHVSSICKKNFFDSNNMIPLSGVVGVIITTVFEC